VDASSCRFVVVFDRGIRVKIPGLMNVPEDFFKTCDEEPIHVPGSIQPHGALLAFSPHSGQLVFASENTFDLLKISSSKQSTWKFDDFAGPGDSNECSLKSIADLLGMSPSQRIPLHLPGRLRFFDIEGHLSKDEYLVLEISQKSDSDPSLQSLSNATRNSLRIKKTLQSIESNRSFGDAMETIASQVREITRYDRVMIYRFDSLGHGEVLVDDRREDLESFLGLHYPASDIPKQARALYLINRVRQLVDTKASQSQVIPLQRCDSSQPTLDMSICSLRSFSPAHLEYLENMGVRATLVLSVILDGKLWGLIVCHHMTPKQITAEMRLQCDLLSHLLSAAIQSEERRQHEQAAMESQACYQRLETTVKTSQNWKEHLLRNANVLLDLVHACGFVWLTAEKKTTLGMIPSESTVDAIASRLSHLNIHESHSTQTLDELPHDWVPEDGDIAGYIAVAISIDPPSYLIWFRQGQSQTVDWGGDPRKAVEQQNEPFRLSPRKSFERWRQELAHVCLPWTDQDHLRAKAVGLYFSIKQTEDANRSKSQFLSNMSHEIRTPMTAILGYTDILLDQLAEGNNACREAAETISRNGHHLLTILNDLLDLAKIEAGKLAINNERLDSRLFVSDTIKLVAANAQKKNIDLICSHSTSLPEWIESDSVRLRQVLLNLLSNSIKFTETGSVTIRTDYRFGENSEEDCLVLEVSDTGAGMSEDVLAKLFQQFEQGDGAISRKHGGTGLGLAISRHLAESMGGSLKATSQVGIGSTFVAEFAVKRIAPQRIERNDEEHPALDAVCDIGKASTDLGAEALAKTSPKRNLSGLKVLVAEDGPDNQRLIRWMLQKKMNADVTIAENGLLAIESLLAAEREKPFQIVLMDLQMPEMDGLSATRKLRSLDIETPIIALTANASELDRSLSLEAGCNHHVAKPIVWDDLLNAIELSLRK
jgi:light-regulated signal transduction histidine kinase (bacteriophytochrome)/ActR/RegA family two-component response regulator